MDRKKFPVVFKTSRRLKGSVSRLDTYHQLVLHRYWVSVVLEQSLQSCSNQAWRGGDGNLNDGPLQLSGAKCVCYGQFPMPKYST